jgi:3-deoxy-manno-octulosonate cytidylyltransferase (CMP-KDO synthetase)
MKQFKAIGIIPSRIGSSRLPKKPLIDILGLPMIIHVLKRVQMANCLDDIYVATDSLSIKKIVEQYGGKVLMTSDKHPMAIERVEEAVRTLNCDIVVMINGDEPALNPDHIETSLKTLLNSDTKCSILASRFSKVHSTSDFKVVLNLKGEAMYVSRSDIPSPARSGDNNFLKLYHIISFKKSLLSKFVKLSSSPLENAEGHDILRLLEYGIKVKVGIVDYDFFSVDTNDDLQQMKTALRNDPILQKYLHSLETTIASKRAAEFAESAGGSKEQ